MSKFQEISFVIDGEGKQLDPMKAVKAWYFIRHGRAKLISKYPMTIQLNRIVPENEINRDKVHIGIDDGAKYVGIAVVQECQTKNKVLLKCTLEQRQDVKKLMEQRRNYRRNRRNEKRYRPKRFDNRASSKRVGRVAPSILQKKQATVRVIKFLSKHTRVTDIHLEDTAFDIRAITDGYKPYRWQYQKSNRLDENIRKAVIIRDENKCQLCHKKNVILEVHHITPRRLGGSNTLGNLITLCQTCHKDVTGREKDYSDSLYKKINGINISGLKYAQHVMQGKTWLQSELGKLARLFLTNGGETANRRIDWRIPKSHSNDAICCTGLIPDELNIQEWRVKPFRKKRRSRVNNVCGFNLRDFVSYTDTKGVKYEGYITAMYPDKNQINFLSPKKHLKRVNAKKCDLLWRFKNIFWDNSQFLSIN